MSQLLFLLCIAGIAVAGSGCFLLSAPAAVEPVCYDLAATDEKVPVAANVDLELFNDKSGNGNRICSRNEEDLTVSCDDMNRFSASPALLVKRRLAICFTPPEKSCCTVAISGELLRFEYLKKKKAVRMVIDYRLSSSGKSRRIRMDLEEKVSGGAKAAAAGFEKCIVRSARMLAGQIDEFAQKCVKEKK